VQSQLCKADILKEYSIKKKKIHICWLEKTKLTDQLLTLWEDSSSAFRSVTYLIIHLQNKMAYIFSSLLL